VSTAQGIIQQYPLKRSRFDKMSAQRVQAMARFTGFDDSWTAILNECDAWQVFSFCRQPQKNISRYESNL